MLAPATILFAGREGWRSLRVTCALLRPAPRSTPLTSSRFKFKIKFKIKIKGKEKHSSQSRHPPCRSPRGLIKSCESSRQPSSTSSSSPSSSRTYPAPKSGLKRSGKHGGSSAPVGFCSSSRLSALYGSPTRFSSPSCESGALLWRPWHSSSGIPKTWSEQSRLDLLTWPMRRPGQRSLAGLPR
jgi:hypothetical protein